MFIPQTTREFYFPEFGSYKNLTTRESAIPSLQPNEVLIKNYAVSLNFRDLVIASGRYTMRPTTNPNGLVPTSDMAGEIVAVGSHVKNWNVGDRVSPNFSPEHLHGDPDPHTGKAALGAGDSMGVLTEYKVVPAHGLVKIPDHLSYEEASTLPCAALTAYNALTGAASPLKAGDYVVVQGTGGVSIFALQFAVATGAAVIATSSSDEKLKVAKKLGAKHLINYKTTPDWDQEVLRITKGRGADHIIEVGGLGTLSKSITAARFGGFIHVIGIVAGNGPVDIIGPSIRKAVTIRGIQVGSVAQFNDMNRLFEANPEVTKPVVDKVFAFEDAVKAYEHLQSQAHVGKVVIKVAQD